MTKHMCHLSVTPVQGLRQSVTPSKGLHKSVTPSKGLHKSVTPSTGLHNSVTPSKGLHQSVTPTRLRRTHFHIMNIRTIFYFGLLLSAVNANELINAVKNDDVSTVTRLLEVLSPHSMDFTDEDDNTALDHAVRKKNSAILELLLIYEANWNQTENVKRLIEAGANVDAKDEDGWTSLMLAASNGKLGVVKLLLKSDADVNPEDKDGRTALMLAARYGKLDVVKLLLESDADNVMKLMNAVDKDGQTSLMMAARYGNLDVVKLLLESDADVDPEDNDGRTALIWAVFNRRDNVVRAILEGRYHSHEIDHFLTIKGRDKKWKAIQKNLNKYLFFISRYPTLQLGAIDTPSFVELLLVAGADVNATNKKDGETSLIRAAKYGNLDVVNLLLEFGADVNVADKDGLTALMFAIVQKRFAVVRVLLDDEYIDVNIKDNKNYTALAYGELLDNSTEDKTYLLKLLKRKGALRTKKSEVRTSSRAPPPRARCRLYAPPRDRRLAPPPAGLSGLPVQAPPHREASACRHRSATRSGVRANRAVCSVVVNVFLS